MIDSVGSAAGQSLALQAVKQEADSAKQVAEVVEESAKTAKAAQVEPSSPEPLRGQNVDTYA